MPATSAAPEPGKRRRRAFLAAAIAIVAAFGVLLHLWRPPGLAWEDEVARLRADGYATSTAEWLGPPVPAEANGAPEIDAADEWLKAELGGQSTWTKFGPWSYDRDPWWKDATPEETAELRALLVRAEPYFRRVEAATRKPHLRWEPPNDPLENQPSVTRRWRLSQFCSAAARFSADPARRLESVATGLRIAARPDRPCDMSEAVWTRACARTALADLRAGVDAGTITAADAARTLDGVPLPRFSERAGDLLRTEIAGLAPLGTEWFLEPLSRSLGYVHPDPGSGPVPVPLRHGAVLEMGMPPVPSSLLRLTWYGPADLLRGLHTAAEVRGATPSEIRSALRPMETPHDCNHHFDPIAMAVRILRDSARLDASAGLTRIALAARLARETTGRWPATLAEVGSDRPPDPFADGPFGYEIQGDAVRVTSRGHFAPDPPPNEESLAEDGLVWTLSAR